MTVEELEKWILKNYLGIIVTDAYKERSFFYNPEGSLPRGIYFTTIKLNDGPNDKASHLDRPGIYPLSVGIGKKHYQDLFGIVPARPAKGETIESGYNFTELDRLMPHPIYAWLGWVCINQTSKMNEEVVKRHLDISYGNVLTKFKKQSNNPHQFIHKDNKRFFIKAGEV